ncbi:hypothetical protein D3880_00485 [Pseudomonas cavernae]|uniref:7TM-DISM receptor extracellular domain-containing protein n=1 Tax=Pseudomonas cavernae TaxID=2320867 RepID=A0A385YZE4_9PSED|nr:hypothetical protein D3880_00485 [Pseudomonas cavernae]
MPGVAVQAPAILNSHHIIDASFPAFRRNSRAAITEAPVAADSTAITRTPDCPAHAHSFRPARLPGPARQPAYPRRRIGHRGAAAAQQPVGPQVEYLLGHEALAFEQIASAQLQSAWQRNPRQSLNLRIQRQGAWLKFDLSQPGGPPQPWFLMIK